MFQKQNSQPTLAIRREVRPDGTLYAVAGFSRSGKSEWTRQQVARAPRLLVWDWPKREWGTNPAFRCRRVESFAELAELVLPDAKPERIAFSRISETPREDFEVWARLAWVYVRAHGAPLVAEELASVTQPGKAPAAWGNICRMGLGYGSDIYAITQRPAESDSTSLGNAGIVHCGIVGTERDRVRIAQELDVPVAQVKALRQFEWIERDRRSGELRTGRVQKSRR